MKHLSWFELNEKVFMLDSLCGRGNFFTFKCKKKDCFRPYGMKVKITKCALLIAF